MEFQTIPIATIGRTAEITIQKLNKNVCGNCEKKEDCKVRMIDVRTLKEILVCRECSEFQKKVDDIIDCQIEDSKLQKEFFKLF